MLILDLLTNFIIKYTFVLYSTYLKKRKYLPIKMEEKLTSTLYNKYLYG